MTKAARRAQAPRAAAWSMDLAVARIVTCALVLASSEVLDAALWAEWGRALRAPPDGLLWALPLLESSAGWLPLVRACCFAATALALLGLWLRWTLPVAALGALVLFAVPHFSGIPRHSMHLVWFMGVLALCPGASRAPLPRLLRQRWALSHTASAGRADAPLPGIIQLGTLRALLACIYFFPGVWKLREAGLAWVLSDNLQNQMFWKWYQFGALPALRVEQFPDLIRLGAASVVLFELCFPLLMLHRWTRLAAAVLGVAFHRAAAELMFLPFSALVGCYVVLVDWSGIWKWLQDLPREAERFGFVRTGARVWARLRAGDSALWVVSAGCAVILSGAALAGQAGAMQAYPFSCYPTFQWRAASTMPDLWISVVRAGEERFLRDSPAFGGSRPQARWGMAWRAAGVYGEAPALERLVGYFQTLPASVQGTLLPGDHVRFYAVLVDVRPPARGAPPLARRLLAEWKP